MMTMTEISRRNLLGAGLAVAGGAVLPTVTLGANATAAPTPSSGRERLLFDFNWKFKLGHGSDPTKDLNFGFGQSDFSKTGEFWFARVGHNDADWRTLDLPHDWAVELPFVRDEAGQGDAQLRSITRPILHAEAPPSPSPGTIPGARCAPARRSTCDSITENQ